MPVEWKIYTRHTLGHTQPSHRHCLFPPAWWMDGASVWQRMAGHERRRERATFQGRGFGERKSELQSQEWGGWSSAFIYSGIAMVRWKWLHSYLLLLYIIIMSENHALFLGIRSWFFFYLVRLIPCYSTSPSLGTWSTIITLPLCSSGTRCSLCLGLLWTRITALQSGGGQMRLQGW